MNTLRARKEANTETQTNFNMHLTMAAWLGLPLLIDNLMGAGSTDVLLGGGLLSKAGRLVNEYSRGTNTITYN